MDTYAGIMANRLVGNSRNTPLIEMTFGNFEIRFNHKALIAVTGALGELFINNTQINLWESYLLNPGDVIKMHDCQFGCRNYLAVQGEWMIGEPQYGSYATYIRGGIGGLNGKTISKGQQISIRGQVNPVKRKVKANNSVYFKMLRQSHKEVRVSLGPQEDSFSTLGIKHFFSEGYQVLPQSDRMGIRLSGKQIGHVKPADIISDGIAFGAIQVPSSGQPIIMMADRQTTGGYTKIGTVLSDDLPIIAQAVTGDVLHFRNDFKTHALTNDIANDTINDTAKAFSGSDDNEKGCSILETRYYDINVNKKNFHIMVEVLEDSL